jgi:hypothetical protein
VGDAQDFLGVIDALEDPQERWAWPMRRKISTSAWSLLNALDDAQELWVWRLR